MKLNTLKTYKEIIEGKDIDTMISQVSKNSKVNNVKKLFSFTTPEQWERIYKQILKTNKKKSFLNWEDIEQYLDNNFSYKEFR